jgi:membrane-anchored protein YejM (alkaline phosphatase superfamily)
MMLVVKRTAQEIGHATKFIIAGFPVTLLALLGYFPGTGTPGRLPGLVYAASIPTYYFILITTLTMALIPLCLLGRAKHLVIAPKACIDSFLFLNLPLYRIYRFHIDPIFLYLFFHDFYGIGLSAHVLAYGAFSCAAVVCMNVFLYRKADTIVKRPVPIFAGALLLFMSGQMLHIWGFEYHRQDIIRYTPHFPYYYPTKSSGTMQAWSSRFPVLVPAHARSGGPEISSRPDSHSVFRYPLKEPAGNGLEKRYNILFFILESWRHDMLNEQVTPVLNGFTRRCSVFTNHLSGGTVTHSGLFSIMYGLHPTYLKYAATNPGRNQPVLMRMLNKSGYDTSVYTTSKLNGFSLKTMLFRTVRDSNYRFPGSRDCMIGDREVVAELVKSIREKRHGMPSFWFVFLTSSHHGYEYPASHAVFQPAAPRGFVITRSDSDPVPVLNRYKNSLHYVDSLFGQVLSALEETRLDRDTVIVVTSDHGEEFNDRGSGCWGHGGNYTRNQVSVPLLIFFPDRRGAIVTKRSCHVDIVPTLMKHVFGCGNDFSEYSSGTDLFHLPDHRASIAMSYVNKAYIIDDTVYAEGIMLDIYHLDDIRKKIAQYRYQASEGNGIALSEVTGTTGPLLRCHRE